MMNNKGFFFVIALFIILSSCGTPKNVVYFQDIGNYESLKKENKQEVLIGQDDLLGIIVTSEVPEAAQPFNLPIASVYIGGDSYGQQRLLGYLVDKEGNIDFPVLGKIHVEGLSRTDLRNKIKEMLNSEDLLKDAIVTVNILNFKISVLGEVARPGTFNITGERITLLEALSMAGDLTIQGRRDRVCVFRETKDTRISVNHDLRSSDIFNSPLYYLQQNDVVYVEPNKRRVQQSNINQNNSVGVWLSILSFLLTTTIVIINTTK